MGEFQKEGIFQGMGLKENDKAQQKHVQWVLMEAKDDDVLDDSESDFVETDSEDSNDSMESSSSSEMVEDASSSSSSSSSSYGPLYELSELMAVLPIKRGLSKHFQGKSQSFASLASVKSLEDLAKKGEFSCRSRKSMRPSKSYGRLSPKATIAKKPSSSSSSSSLLSSLGKMSSFMANST